MKNYAADLKGEKDIVKHQQYVENFYKKASEQKILDLTKQLQESNRKLQEAESKLNMLKKTTEASASQHKSLTDKNHSLSKKNEALKTRVAELEEAQKNMVTLDFGKPKDKKARRHIELDD